MPDKNSRVARFDVRKIEKSRKTDNGFLIAPVRATRSGVFTYRTKDGGILREYRPESEVFNEDSMSTLAMVPVTNRHPGQGLIDAKTAKKFSVGSVGENISREDNFLRANLVVFDEDTINDIENDGIREVSCGYRADLEFTPGITDEGEEYDAIQRNIRYNHLATVRRGRAGRGAKMMLDSDCAVLDDGDIEIENLYEFVDSVKPKKEGIMPKMKLNGVEFEVEGGLGNAIKAELNDAQESAKVEAAKLVTEAKAEAQAKVDEAQAKLDAANEQLEKAKADSIDEKKINELAKERSALLAQVSGLVKADTDLDALTNAEIKKAVVEQNCKIDKAEKLDSEVYVDARFDAVIEDLQKKKKDKDPVKKSMGKKVENEDGGDDNDPEAIRANRMRADQEAWMQPLGKTVN